MVSKSNQIAELNEKTTNLMNILFYFFFTEWLLADFVRPKPFLGASKRNIDKYFDKNLSGNSNGTFSLVINGENNSTPRKTSAEMHLNHSGRSSNGNADQTET